MTRILNMTNKFVTNEVMMKEYAKSMELPERYANILINFGRTQDEHVQKLIKKEDPILKTVL